MDQVIEKLINFATEYGLRIVGALLLLIIGLALVGKKGQEIWELIKPFWEKAKGWWKRIQGWWDDVIGPWWEKSFIKRILDDVEAAGGWMKYFKSLLRRGIDAIKKKLTDSAIYKWIESVKDWWDNFSLKDVLLQFWNKLKTWIFEKWNGFCDWLSKKYIAYPSGVDVTYTGDPNDPWYKKCRVWMYDASFTWGEWYPFSFLSNWKADVPQTKVEEVDLAEAPPMNEELEQQAEQ